MSADVYNIEEYIALKKGLSKHFESATHFTPENLKKYNELLKEFEESNESKDSSKGKKLENLVRFIFDNIDVFEVYSNIYTSTNEIDHLVALSEFGQILARDGLFDIKGNYLLCECKNYTGTIDVTWVGKFCNLVSDQPARIGILFSHKGFRGKGNWDSAKGLVKKFYYRKENYSDKMYIIDFNLNEFKRLGAGESFINIIKEKVQSIETDTDFEKYLTRHPAQ
ncbi:acetylglutamate semialdehyde dehydrogenase [Turicibacter sanguinis]|uniref:Acetylglutamate semialdehyde dehydrogenase n=1 Tax=Turicibacter sanguinis TaxID=154288 RepID=A0A9X4XFB9_9FIRM|nr:acetylglutamate semialdehyde dehydrogenase [Turicibacter sanguinis]MTK72089.1 acetylglutamate semialdehyde dehydrogenase [Turicibacter sanguinis]MTP74072.1 acetylglutamate semialdehyde dehydrogenase [Turicibacter sanguinis]